MATDWSMQQFVDEIFIEAQFFSNWANLGTTPIWKPENQNLGTSWNLYESVLGKKLKQILRILWKTYRKFFGRAFGDSTGFFVGNPVSSGEEHGNIDTAEKYWLPNGL